MTPHARDDTTGAPGSGAVLSLPAPRGGRMPLSQTSRCDIENPLAAGAIRAWLGRRVSELLAVRRGGPSSCCCSKVCAGSAPRGASRGGPSCCCRSVRGVLGVLGRRVGGAGATSAMLARGACRVPVRNLSLLSLDEPIPGIRAKFFFEKNADGRQDRRNAAGRLLATAVPDGHCRRCRPRVPPTRQAAAAAPQLV